MSEDEDEDFFGEGEDQEEEEEELEADEGAAPALTGRQRRKLRALGHHLEPVMQIGKGGLNDATYAALDDALETHELIKVKVLQHAPESAKEVGPKIASRLSCSFVQSIGRVALFYRPADDPADRKIEI